MIQKNERRRYASDLSDGQWAIFAPLFPRAGNRSKWEKCELVDAVFYYVDNGCKWRNLPHDFPPYTTVANFYYAVIQSGLWERTRAALVERVRTDAGRNTGLSYAIIDSQSVKITSASEERGIDGKNKRAQKVYRSRYHGESVGGGGSCCQYTQYKVRCSGRERPSRNIHPFNGSGLMQDTAKPLSKTFPKRWIVERFLGMAQQFSLSVQRLRDICLLCSGYSSYCRFSYLAEKVLAHWYSILESSLNHHLPMDT